MFIRLSPEHSEKLKIDEVKEPCSIAVSSLDLKAIRNLLVSMALALLFILVLHYTIYKTTHQVLASGNKEAEEIVWYVINENFKFDEKDLQDKNYYQFFQQYIQDIVNKMPEEILPKDYAVQIVVTHDYSINAFAAPGGRILITRGLLDKIKSENGLMFVIGHEIGHLHRKDHIREFSRSLAATIISSMFFSGNSEVVDFLLLIDNNLSRQSEIAADEWGLKTLVALYGHAGGATEFFNILLENDIGTADEFPSLSSHPPTDFRNAMIETKIKSGNIPIYKLASFD